MIKSIDIKKSKLNNWYKLSGKIITLRDSTQIEIIKHYEKTKKLPIDLKNKIVLYGAPSKSKKIIIGPTTSKRMDGFLEFISKQGVIATIGKGDRSQKAKKIIKKHKAPYFILMSGVSSYLSEFFKNEKIIALNHLGPEAIREYEVKDLPILCAIDINGNSIF
jgi:fumarate hydratase subunit beta